MITELKGDFIVKTLDRNVANIFEAQRIIAERNVYVRGRNLTIKKKKGKSIGRYTGRLMSSLSHPSYTIVKTTEGFIVNSSIMQYMRFLDMKRMGNREIYNKQLWGILYRRTFPSIKYDYGKNVHDALGAALKKAAKTK